MINALSPLDGRYSHATESLRPIFSEAGLIKARIAIEVEWLIYVCNELKLEGSSELTEDEMQRLRKLYMDFQDALADEVKKIEKETRHDVKAVEYFLQKALRLLKRDDLIPFIHFACTSEDINNLSHAYQLKKAVNEVMLPEFDALLAELGRLADEYVSVPMMARTHGQAASPTTVGKELKNVKVRLERQVQQLRNQEFMGKMNGATGNFNAHVFVYPNVNWPKASKAFVEKLGFTWQAYTTQIEPHDAMAELFDVMQRLSTILIDFSRDLWMYISFDLFKQKLKEGEVGSSTMPHKVNPIDFENAEGNLGLANALFGHLARKLPVSRMQRDLTDSTVIRNVGCAFGYSLLALKSMMRGLSKLELNEPKLQKDLAENWALLAEPIQMMLRRYGDDNAYEKLKALTRGKEINKETIAEFVQAINLPDEAKKRLLELSPDAYIGLANQL